MNNISRLIQIKPPARRLGTLGFKKEVGIVPLSHLEGEDPPV